MLTTKLFLSKLGLHGSIKSPIRSRMKYLSRLLLTAFLCILSLSSPSLGEGLKLKIGYITDLTGMGAFFGIPSQYGARLAAKELNDEGNQIEIVFEDARSKNAEAISAATRFIEIEHVDAVICDLTPTCTAISTTLQRANKPLIYHSPSVRIAGSNPLAFRNFIDYVEACGALAEESNRRGFGRIAALVPNLEFGEQCGAGVMKVAPDSVLFQYNPGDDLRSALLKFKSAGVKSVVHVGYEPDFLNWFKLSGESNAAFHQAFSEFMLSDTLRKSAAAQLPGSLLVSYQPLPETFVEKLIPFGAQPGAPNLQGSALAYNAVMALREAAQSCPARSGTCWKSALPQVKHGLLGFTGFSAERSPYPLLVKEYRDAAAK